MQSNTEYKNQKAVDYILRCAIKEGGHAGYNPYMYDLGCADNIGPSEDFNNELKNMVQSMAWNPMIPYGATLKSMSMVANISLQKNRRIKIP